MDFLQPKKFRYTLTIRGIETIAQTKTTPSPNGWLDTSVKYEKSKTYGGLFRSLTLPLNFTFDAAVLLSKEFTNYGVLAHATVLIEIAKSDWSYKPIFNGVLDFSKAVDLPVTGEFQIPAISNDFSVQLAAYDSVKYDIPVNVPQALDIELTPLLLTEQATFLPEAPPDGVIHADYFPPMEIINYTARSIISSSRGVVYRQFRNPDYSSDQSFFFQAQVDTLVNFSGQITFRVQMNTGAANQKLYFVNQNGTVVYAIYSQNTSSGFDQTITKNLSANIQVTKGDKLFLYTSISIEEDNSGITIDAQNSNIVLRYNTISESSFCKGLPLSYVFDQLLTKMNVNVVGAPNGSVPWQSSLLTNTYKDVIMTCSNAIRTKDGDAVNSGGYIAPGLIWRVTNSVTYNGVAYTTGDLFLSIPSVTTFTGVGSIAQTGVIANVGNTYNAGDTLPAGGKFLVRGNTINYNGQTLAVNTFFNYILGVDSFTTDDADNPGFVQEVSEQPSIQITFADFFQTILSISGGDCQLSISNGVVILESLGYIYQPVQSLDFGIADKTTKREAATDKMYNAIKCGYVTQQYDTVNGAKEVNATQNYFTVMQFITATLNLISPSRADCYGIEQVRITAGDTSASRSDNDPYIIWLEDSQTLGWWQPLGQDGITITGVDQGFYNWKLSPKHNLLRGSRYLASIYYHMKGYQIMLAGADKNAAMVVTENGVRIAEADPISIDTLGAPYFLPYYWTTNVGLKTTALSFVDDAPFGYMAFEVNGVTVTGYSESVTFDIGKNSAQAFKLLQGV